MHLYLKHKSGVVLLYLYYCVCVFCGDVCLFAVAAGNNNEMQLFLLYFYCCVEKCFLKNEKQNVKQ